MLGLVNLQQTLIDAGEVALVAFVNDCGQLLFRMAGLKVYPKGGALDGSEVAVRAGVAFTLLVRG